MATVKERVFTLLTKQKNVPVSGEEIAHQLGVTRAAVWKAIKTLVQEGCEIEAVNNKGYTLKVSADVLSEAYIDEKISETGFDIEVRTMRTIDSTNNYLKLLAGEGKTNDCVVISEEQTAGRGRRGRSFYSPVNTGIYISFLLHPKIAVSEAPGITTMTAVAVAQAVEEVSKSPVDIKWVNDIWVNGKKISGILTEASTSMEDGSLEYVVVGIGINIYEPKEGFPDEIKAVAGSIFQDSVHRENMRNELAGAVIVNFLKYYKEFAQKTYLEGYRERCFVIGKEVNLISADHEVNKLPKERDHAFVLGVDDDCHLHVRYEDGTEEYISNGEISIRV